MIKFPIKIEEMRKRACNEFTIEFECEFINIEKKENEKMAKLTGYQSVAVVELGSGYSKKDYYFAIYEDGTKYAVGDTVYVSGNGSDRIVTIKDFVAPDFIEENIPKGITAEVICKINTAAYEYRVMQREEAAKLRKEMDKVIKEMDESKKYEMYAAENPALRELLDKYNELENK